MTVDALADSRRSALLRTVAVGAATVCALPFTFRALLEDYRYGAAMGELALLPLCAFVVALAAAHRHPWIVRLRAGRADHVVSLLLFGLAGGLLLVLPVVLGNTYFAVRPDLLAIPLVAAGAVSLLFGVRALVAFVAPLLVALLAWPLPLRGLLEPLTGAVAGATATGLRGALDVLPLAAAVSGEGDLRLLVAGGDGPFEVVVASACSGTTGIAGMLLVGLAAQYVLHGSRRSRVAWLAAAALIAWVLNLARILLLLAVGRAAGEQAALELFHPVAGLLLLNVGFVALLLAAPRFGLRLSLARTTPTDTPLCRPAPAEQVMGTVPLARRFVLVAVGVGTLAVLNTTLPGTAAAYDRDGAPTAAFTATTAVPGFDVSAGDEQRWARRYFGDGAQWLRFRLSPTSEQVRFSVWADAIRTPHWGALRAHPVLTCYRFHDYDVLTVERTVISRGLLADSIVYRNGAGATWHVLSWEWPVRQEDGALVHERVTLLASSAAEHLATADGRGTRGDLRSALAQRVGGTADGTDPNPSLTLALRDTARALLTSRGAR